MNIFNKVINFFKTPFKKQLVRSYSKKWFSFFSKDLYTNETIFSAVDMLSDAVASMPVNAYFRKEKITNPNEHSLAKLFALGPNQRTTMFDFIKLMEINRCTKGVGYAIMEYDNYGDVSALWPLEPDFVTPMIEKDSNELYYQIRVENGPYYVHESNIIAMYFMRTGETTYINPLDLLKDTINYDNKVKEFSLNQMKNALDINYVFKLTDAKLSKENKEMYNEMIQQFFEEGIAILDAGSEVAQFATKSYLDPNISTIDKITVERVERVYRLNGKLSRNADNNKSIDTEDLTYLQDSILPIARQYEQEFTKKLFKIYEILNGYYIKFNMRGFARANLKNRGDFYQQALRGGWMCQDDIRELEDMPPIPNGLGQQFYISRDLIPIDKLDKLLENSSTSTKLS